MNDPRLVWSAISHKLTDGMSALPFLANETSRSPTGQSQLQTKLNFYVRFGRYRLLHIPGVMPAQAGISGGGVGRRGWRLSSVIPGCRRPQPSLG
jgi:hypothetical protein